MKAGGRLGLASVEGHMNKNVGLAAGLACSRLADLPHPSTQASKSNLLGYSTQVYSTFPVALRGQFIARRKANWQSAFRAEIPTFLAYLR